MGVLMNSNAIFQAIEKIAATPGKNDKQALVAQLLEDEQGRRALVAAYDSMVTYGIASFPDSYPSGEEGKGEFNDGTWQLLTDLASRKLSGNAARDALVKELDRLCDDSFELLRRIVLKDMRAGFTDGTINRARPGTIKEFPYMRCCLPKDAKVNAFPWTAGCFSQEKADGMFANINHAAGGVVSIHSRQGTAFPAESIALMELRMAVRATLAEDTQTHGELLVLAEGKVLPREIANGMLNSVAQGGELPENHRIVFMAWDQIPLSAVKPKGKHDVPYVERFKALLLQVKEAPKGEVVAGTTDSAIRVIPTRIVHSLAEAYAHSADMMAAGKEGTIIKHRNATWKDGTSREQVKLKLEVDVDLKVVGFEAGKGKNESTFGSIITRTSDDLLEVCVSGFTDKQRKEIHEKREEILGSIMTVKANAVMKPSSEGKLHSLFLPRFVEFRTDKTEADSLQRVIDQFEAAVKGDLKEAA
jgi:DNA ligase-1